MVLLSSLIRKCFSAVTKISIALLAILLLLVLRSSAAGHQVVLEVNGKAEVKRTRSRTVGELLEESKVKVVEADKVSPSVATPVVSGMKVKVKKAVPVIVEIEGEERRIVTTASKVSDALVSHGIQFNSTDRISPPLHSSIRSGMKILVAKETVKEEKVREPIAFKVIRQRDETLELGKKVVRRRGRSGLAERIFRVTYRGGEVIARELVREVIKARPIAEVVRIGTLKPFVVSRGQESPGNRELASSGAQTSGQPLNPANSQEGIASYYTLNGKGIGMTAAHKTLPYGTRVRVINLSNNKQVEVVINDRGPYKRGRIIDLATDAFRVIAPTSRGICRVRIEW